MVDIVVGVPMPSKIDTNIDFTQALGDCVYTLTEAGYKVKVIKRTSCLVSNNRLELCHQAIKEKAKYLMMFDDDMIFPPDTVIKLLAHGKPIVGCLYFNRQLPFKPHIYKYKRDDNKPPEQILKWDKGLIEVDAMGFGAVLIETAILGRIPQPWFSIAPAFLEYDGKDFKIDKFKLDNTKLTVGEDLWFCYLAGKSGIKLYVDTNLSLYHIGEYMYSEEDFHAYNESQK